MPFGTEEALGTGRIVLDGDSAHPKTGHSHPLPIFDHVFWNQTAGWMMVSLGTEVGLGPGNIVLDGDPLQSPPPKKGTAARTITKTARGIRQRVYAIGLAGMSCRSPF